MARWRWRLSRTVLSLLVPLGLVVGTVACGASSTSISKAPTAPPLTIAEYPGLSITWWPPIPTTANCGRPGGVTGPDMYIPLLWLNRQDQLSFSHHALASGVTVNSQDTSFTVTMNPKWKWSNGSPVTAQDVVYYWQLIKASTEGNQAITYCYVGSGGFPTDWQSVTAHGAHTVVVTTTKPVNPVWFEHNGLTQLIAIPKATWDKYGSMKQELAWIQSIGNAPLNAAYQVVDGPYRIAKVAPNQYWKFVANPHYSGATKPTYKTIYLDYETSDSTTFLALKKGTVQVVPTASLTYLREEQKLSGYRLLKEPSYGFYYLQMNFRTNAKGIGGLFNHLYVRQALQMGVDQPAIIAVLYKGLALPTYGPVPSAPKNVFYDYGQKNSYPYNPARGKTLLEAHGWHLVHGVMEKNGQQLAFPFLVQTGTSSTHLAEILQRGWAEEGIKVSLVPESLDSMYGLIGNPAKSSQWALAGGSEFGWLYIPDFYPSGGSLFASGAGFNLGGYDSTTMDHLIAATYEAGSASQVRARFNAYQKYAAQNLPVLYQPTADTLSEVATSVHGWASGFNPIEAYTPWNRLHS